MSLRINTNTSASIAYDNLQASQASAAAAVEKLSSGLRINHAADDASGLSISQGLTSQLNGLTEATSNIAEGMDVTTIADGALASSQAILQRMRALAVKYANTATMDPGADAAVTDEFQSLSSQLDNIARQTNYHGRALLDGAYSGTFQVGANGGDVIAVDLTQSALTAPQPTWTYTSTDDGQLPGRDWSAYSTNGVYDDGYYSLTSGSPHTSTQTSVAPAPSPATTGTVTTTSSSFAPDPMWPGGLPGLPYGSTVQPGTTTQTTTTTVTTSGAVTTTSVAVSTPLTPVYNVTDPDAIKVGTVTLASGFNAASLGVDFNADDNANQILYGPGIPPASHIVMTTGSLWPYGEATSSPFDYDGVISHVDNAIAAVSYARSRLGATQNQLAYSRQVAQNTVVNIAQARSSITDADMATEAIALSQAQIVSSTATSVLAQANSQPQVALKLLDAA